MRRHPSPTALSPSPSRKMPWAHCDTSPFHGRGLRPVRTWPAAQTTHSLGEPSRIRAGTQDQRSARAALRRSELLRRFGHEAVYVGTRFNATHEHWPLSKFVDACDCSMTSEWDSKPCAPHHKLAPTQTVGCSGRPPARGCPKRVRPTLFNSHHLCALGDARNRSLRPRWTRDASTQTFGDCAHAGARHVPVA